MIEQLHVDLRGAARRHMAAWSHEAARADWEGYCRSHTHVAQLWREVIERERELIYPLLG
jgi:hypothetical protein